MSAGTITSRAPVRVLRSKRLLALARDERLVDQIRRGNELAFEVAFERHGTGILAFCRHMLGSREEAEDAVQHTFAAAYRDLQRSGERSIALKAWLYTIARNRCVSVLRARREQATDLHELPTAGLSEQVEQRAELRELLADVRELPEDQRAALLLAEAAGLSHAEVAEVLGCEVASVKGIVFRARSSLIERRAARETPCHEIREQLATLRGGSLRRNELRHHLRQCPGCSAYRDQVRRQRQMLAVALPVAPSLGLKSSVMGAAGLTGGAAAGAGAGGGLALGSAALAKVAVVGVLAGGSVVAGEIAVEQALQSDGPVQQAPAADRARSTTPPPLVAPRPESVRTSGTHGEQVSTERNHGQRGAERRTARSHRHGNTGSQARTNENSAGGRRLGQDKRASRTASEPRGQAKQPNRVKPVTQSRPAPQGQAAPKAAVPAEPPTVEVPEAAPA
ncbi:MAG TPA: RNA polymerase sigma factor, partial [Thermoleophilaceae bacterium]